MGYSMNTGSMDPNSAIMDAILANLMKPYSSKAPQGTPNGGLWGNSWQAATVPQFDMGNLLSPPATAGAGFTDNMDWLSGKTKTPTGTVSQGLGGVAKQSPTAGVTAQGLGGWSIDPRLGNTQVFPNSMDLSVTGSQFPDNAMAAGGPSPTSGNAMTEWLAKNQPIIDTTLKGLTALNALTSMYTGWKGLDLAGDMFSFQKDAWNKNYANQVSDYNRQVTDLASARQGYDPNYDRAGYLKKNLLEGAV